MCEIFPEVENCCYFFSLRIGMLFIALLGIMSGAMTWSIVEQTSNKASLDELLKVPTAITDVESGKNQFSTVIIGGVCAMSAVFILTGLILLIADLSDSEGFVQVFVWLTFLNVMLGFVFILGLSINCMTEENCLLSGMDWLSGSAFLTFLVIYLFVWLYFISVANSYVLGVAA